MLGLDPANLWVMDVAAYHHVAPFARAIFTREDLKIVHVLHRALDAVFDALAQRHARASQGREAGVDHVVDQDEHVVTPPAELGQPFGAVDRSVKGIAMEEEVLLAVDVER